MATVNSIDIQQAKVELKKCPILVQQYVSGLEKAVEMSQNTTQKAIKKIKELSKADDYRTCSCGNMIII